MKQLSGLAAVSLLVLAGCVGTPPDVRMAPDGKPLPTLYKIKPADEGRITYSMIDSINALRQAAGAQPLQPNPLLTAAAATHARDMSVQNRPWHFGSDGSSPLLRVQRTGYQGRMLGENISETYETEIETLSAWMELPDTRAVILDPAARDVGFSWYQEPSGKLWWTLVTGG